MDLVSTETILDEGMAQMGGPQAQAMWQQGINAPQIMGAQIQAQRNGFIDLEHVG